MAVNKSETSTPEGQTVPPDSVTGQKEDHSNLQAELQEFRAIFELADVGKALIDTPERRFLRVNAAFCRLTGYDEEELLSLSVDDLNHPDDRHSDREKFDLLLNGEADRYEAEKRYVRKDGSVIWVHAAGNLICGTDGVDQRATAVVTDITEKRRLQEQVRTQFEELESIYRTAPIGLALIDAEFRFVRINDWLAAINGIPAEDHVGRKVSDVVPAIAEQAGAIFERVMGTGEPVLDVIIEGEAPLQPGSLRAWKESWYPLRNRAGETVAVNVIVEEVTEQKRAGEKLRFLAELNQTLRPVVEPAEIMSTTAGILGDYLKVDRCAYAEIEDEQIFVITGDYSRTVPSIVGRWPVAAFGPECVRCMLENRPYIVSDSENDPRIGPDDLPAYRATDIRSVICVPLHKQGKFTAAMAVHQKTVRVWAEEEIDLVQMVVSRCWESLERARADRSLRESEERLRLATEAAEIFSWETDWQSGKIKWAENTCKVIGCDSSELSDNIADGLFFVLPEDKARVQREFEEACSSGRETFHFEFRGNEPETDRKYWESRGLIIYGPDKQPLRVIGVTQNVTVHRLAEEALKESNERERAARRDAEAANRAKDDFLAVLSHELRTPLHSMKGWLALLENETTDTSQREKGADAIKRSLTAQTRLVDDLLDVSRIISGTLELEKKMTPLATTVVEAVEDVKSDADEKGITLAVELDSTMPEIYADPQRLRQVLNNLFVNAIKFTPRAGHIKVGLIKAGERAIVTVSDTGSGIEPAMLGRIFDRFQQADSTSRRRHGGLGLGLAIARHLVEMHGGTIRAESDGPGKGSAFTLEFPLARVLTTDDRSNGKAASGQSSIPPAGGLGGKRILVVDDNEDARMVLGIALGKSGADVITSESAVEALNLLEKEKFDLLVCDIGMPDMNGHDLMMEVRGRLGLGPAMLPAVALSGFAAREDRDRSLAAGFQMHVSKPIDPFAFSKALSGLIDAGYRNI